MYIVSQRLTPLDENFLGRGEGNDNKSSKLSLWKSSNYSRVKDSC